MRNNKQQTAVELLFLEFKSLSKVSRDAGDEQTANLIDFLCEREQQAKEMEKERLTDAYHDGKNNGMDISHPWSKTKEISAEEWYNETYGGKQ
jgi:hypothetical protein